MSISNRQLAAIVLLALVPRLIAAIALGDALHFADEAEYADAARGLLSGDGFGTTYRRVPGYPALLALLAAPAPGSILWLRCAQAVIVALGAALTFLAAERLIGRGGAIVAAVLYALDPLLVVASSLLYPEAAAAIIMIGVVWLLWEASRRATAIHAVAAGSLLGLLALFRPVALGLVPVAAGWLLFATPARPARRVLNAGLLGLVCFIVLAPWTYRNYSIHGRLIPVSLAGTHGASTEALVAGRSTEPLVLAARIAREFGHFWELVPSRLMSDDPAAREAVHRRDARLPTRSSFSRPLRDAVSAASFGIELLLALVGLAAVWRSRQREAILLAAVVLAYALGHSLFVGKLRYRITVLPLVFVFAGAGAAYLHAALRARRDRATA